MMKFDWSLIALRSLQVFFMMIRSLHALAMVFRKRPATFATLVISVVATPSRAEIPSTRPVSKVWPADQEAKFMGLMKQKGVYFQRRQKLIGNCSVLRYASGHTALREQLVTLNQKIDAVDAKMLPFAPPWFRPIPPHQLAIDDQFMNSVLVAIEDPGKTAQVRTQATSSDPTIAAIGHLTLLQGQWFSAPDAASRRIASDDIVKFLKTADQNDKEVGYAVKDAFFTETSSDAALRDAIVVAYPNKQVVAGLVAFKHEERDAALNASLVNKPMVLAGATSDGKQFTTANWKGKVVLVDFWATWCGPCKASLPHMKDIYKKYHSQGLEIVGVSNDTSKESLEKFLAADPAMCWPDLFDAKAASDDKWDPLSEKFGVNSIPRMFLIDRNGICRTVAASENMDVLISKLVAEPASAVSMTK